MDKREYMDKFKRCILEYTSPSGGYEVDEEGEDMMQGGGAPMGGDPSMGGGAPMGDPGMGGDPMGGDPSMGGGAPMGGDPSMGGGAPMGDPGMGGDPSMGGGDPNAIGGDPNAAGGQPPQGFQPQGAEEGAPMDGMGADPNAQGADPNADPNAQGEDEEVIDVDDLTNSQEETEKKVDALSGKFEKLLASLDNLEKKISDVDSHTNEYLGKLEAEFDKRNPTPMQRMTMRSTKSAPYAMTPNEYMNNYAPENYSDADDNNGADDPQYKITKGDIDDFTDYGSMSKKFGSSFDLHDILGY